MRREKKFDKKNKTKKNNLVFPRLRRGNTGETLTAYKISILAMCLALSVVSALTIYQRQSVFMYVALSVIVAALTLFWQQFKSLYAKIMKYRAGRVAIRVVAVLAVTGALYIIVISCLMISAIFKAPQDGSTLIVLGCQVRGEQPSLMLSRRIDAAFLYLQENPAVGAVLSGGQGPGEHITEAEAIFRALTRSGIGESRLLLETASTSTYENIAFTEPIIDRHGLPRNVAIVTDGFHQYRAQHFAKQMGLTPGSVPSKTPFYVVPYYWLREITAITQQVILGLGNA